jgi:hypothetical protein
MACHLQASPVSVNHSFTPPLLVLHEGICGGVEGRRWRWEEVLHTERILVRRQKQKRCACFIKSNIGAYHEIKCMILLY